VARGIESILATPEDRSQNSGVIARRLVGELHPYGRELLVLALYIVVGAVTQAGGPWLISQAIDQDIIHPNPDGLALHMLALFLVYLIGTFASRAQVYRVGAVGQKVLAGLRARLFDQFQHLPLGYFDRHPIGDLMSRVINDVDTINQLLSQGLTQLVGSLFSLIGILIAMLFLNVPLALVSFLVIPVMLLTTSFFAKPRRSIAPTRTSLVSGRATGPIAMPTCRRSRSPRHFRRRLTCSAPCRPRW